MSLPRKSDMEDWPQSLDDETRAIHADLFRPFCPECDLGVNSCTCELEETPTEPGVKYRPEDFA